jgi:hypothetical protein
VLALSFHAVFEGLAVGLEEEQHDVWTLFAGKRLRLSLFWTWSYIKYSWPGCIILGFRSEVKSLKL